MKLLEAVRYKGNGKHHIIKDDGEPYYRTALCGLPLSSLKDTVDESTVPEWARCKSCFRFYAGGSR